MEMAYFLLSQKEGQRHVEILTGVTIFVIPPRLIFYEMVDFSGVCFRLESFGQIANSVFFHIIYNI